MNHFWNLNDFIFAAWNKHVSFSSVDDGNIFKICKYFGSKDIVKIQECINKKKTFWKKKERKNNQRNLKKVDVVDTLNHIQFLNVLRHYIIIISS